MDERRKTSRVNISFPVKCTVLPERRSNFCTVTKDLSPSGLKILCEGFIPVGKILKVHVNLLNETLAAKAQVVWCNRRRHAYGYYAGLHFLEIN